MKKLLFLLLIFTACAREELILPCEDRSVYINEMVLINWYQCHVEKTEEREIRFQEVREQLCNCYPELCLGLENEFIIN